MVYDNGVYQYIFHRENDLEIRKYLKDEDEVVIPGEIDGYPVASIAMNAFSMCGSLTKVWIPEGVYHIGVSVFGHCGRLNYVSLPESLEIISFYVFKGCDSLKELVIPKNVKEFGLSPFPNDPDFRLIVIPDSPAEKFALRTGFERVRDDRYNSPEYQDRIVMARNTVS